MEKTRNIKIHLDKQERWPFVSKSEIGIINDVLKTNKLNYWTGKNCKLFEKEFSKFIGKKYGISLCNASVALDVSLKSLSLKKGDEIIVTPRSYISSASCVINNGLKPVFADVDPFSQNITAENIIKVLTKKTKAIILVHLAGFPCEIDDILKISRKYRLKIIEDCSQSHGAMFRDKYTGSFGDIAVWSFCNDKIMNTLGEGGMICVDNKDLFKKMWSLKDCGKNYEKFINTKKSFKFKWVHDFYGTNLRMTEVQAAVGRFQLKKLNYWVNLRNKYAKIILKNLKGLKNIYLFQIPNYIKHSYYRLYVRLNKQEIDKNWNKVRIIKELNSRGVFCNSGTCPEIYKEKAFTRLNINLKKKRNAAMIADDFIAFMVHPTLKEKNIIKSSLIIREILSKAQK